MNFDLVTSIFLDNELRKIGIDRNLSIISKQFTYFSIEELSEIESLTIQGIDDIRFLLYLPCLKKLKIYSEDYSNVIVGGSYQDSTLFNNISDFSVIESLYQLEELEIVNDINIQKIDFMNLVNLRKIIIANNPNLTHLLNMGNMHFLETVVMYGNNIKVFENFDEYLDNTLDATINILDSNTYFSKVKSVRDATKLYEKSISGKINVQFSEKSGLLEYTTTYLSNMTELYTKIRRRLQTNKVFDKTDEEKIQFVYNYGLKIKFAQDELVERQNLYEEILNKYKGIPNFYKKRLSFLHNSYSTFHFNYGNCEGIVNLMHIMLSILGIESENVHCHDRRYNYSMVNNHALLRIKTVDGWFYYDAVYDRTKLLYKKTYDEISEYVDLSEYEREKSEENEYGQHDGTNIRKFR